MAKASHPRKLKRKIRSTLKERGPDLHETPPEAVLALLQAVPIPWRVWEPCAGLGAIARVLAWSGRKVLATDLHAHAGAFPGITAPVDFFNLDRAPAGYRTIVTNPPYRRTDAFVRHGLTLCDRVVVLLRLAALEGSGRSDLIDGHLRTVYLGRERLPNLHRVGWRGPKIPEAPLPYAWFVFESQLRTTSRRFEVERISWRVPVPDELKQPREAA